MSLVEKIKEQMKYGMPIFEKLFNMPSAELKTKLESICENKLSNFGMDILKNGGVSKQTINDKPEDLEIWYYGSCVAVTPLGITFTPEHGKVENVIQFDQNFKLD